MTDDNGTVGMLIQRSISKLPERLFLALAVALACFLLPFEATARTIYVDDDQSGRGDGTREAPYATITEAAKRARSGDVVAVAPGTYRDPITIERSGSRAAPIVIRPIKAGTVLIDGSRTPRGSDLVRILADYVVFEGFEIRNAKRSAISIWGARGVTIRENKISGSVRSAIWAGHDRPGQSQGIRIEKNIVFGNVLENRARNWSRGWARAIAVDLTRGAIIRGNRVYNNFGEGIGALSTRDVKIHSNVVYDNFSVNIYLDNAPATSVRGNVVYTKRNRQFYRHGSPALGIAIANEHTRFPKQSTSIRVTENKLAGVGDVIYGTWGANTGLKNSVIGPNQVN